MSQDQNPRFVYCTVRAGEPAKSLTRAEAVERLHTRAGDILVTYYPGAVTCEVSAGRGLRGDPEPLVSGWGYLPAQRAERCGRVLIEAAAVAREAER